MNVPRLATQMRRRSDPIRHLKPDIPVRSYLATAPVGKQDIDTFAEAEPSPKLS
jgi:hypothetical protein